MAPNVPRQRVVLRNESARRVRLPALPGLPQYLGPFEEWLVRSEGDLHGPLATWAREGILTLRVEREPSGLRALLAPLRSLWWNTQWLRSVVAVAILLAVCALASAAAALEETGSSEADLNLWSVLIAAVPGILFLTQEQDSREQRSLVLRRLAACINPRGVPANGSGRELGSRWSGGSSGMGSLLLVVLGSAALTLCLARLVLPLCVPPVEGGLSSPLRLLEPRGQGKEAFVLWALFGSYVLALQLFRRGFTRGSLTSDMFALAVLRLLLTVLIASALHGLVEHAVHVAYRPIVALSLGFWPALGLEAVAGGLRKVTKLGSAQRRSDDVSLRSLVDVDHLLQTRLEECGIETASDLAGADPLALLRRIRLPPRALMSAIDQALLLSRVGESGLNELKALGVISATDVVALHRSDEALPEVARLPGHFWALGLLLESDANVRQAIRWRAFTGDHELVADSPDDFAVDPADGWRPRAPRLEPAASFEEARSSVRPAASAQRGVG